MKNTAPRLTKERIDIALDLLDQWSGKLTWERFLAILEVEVGHKYTKAALLRHEKFKNAWDQRRWASDDKTAYYGNNQILKLTLEKIQKLEQKIERLEYENKLLTEKFVIWATNAMNKGISAEELNRPIPVNSNKETS
ncbi:hypothetical protein [Acinetobacter radioresistens]|uniref:hypothetical protein n=1 Tax=Acinetobacter radioresistens TaxID=40216 RepID=UPI002245DC8E|nr:hypothetical protein [Acinetobacter radioresistens]MCX0339448.1 hypothetical protein [Acinetobacter radioresistens]